ncbi:MAG: response regulator [Actinomycetes bacterium]
METIEWRDARVLVVDDEAPIRQLVQLSLQRAGYRHVETASDVASAVEAAGRMLPDLVLLDIHMPGGSGLLALSRFREDPDLSEVPVLIMTGAGTPQNIASALELGAVDIVHKPVGRVELLLRVRNLLRQRRLGLSLREHNRRLDHLVAERSEELSVLAEVLDRMPVPAFVFEPDGRLRYANARGRQLEAPGGGEIHGVVGEALDREGPMVVRAEDGTGTRRYECVVHRDGAERVTVLLHDVETHLEVEERLHTLVAAEQDARERARRLDDLREDIATAVSHRVRTPLTVVKGAAEVLHRRADELEHLTVSRMHRSLYDNSLVLERMLLDLLDLAAMSRGDTSNRRVGVDLLDIVGSAATRTTLDLCTVGLEPHRLVGDPELLRRVFANVLDNVVAHVGPEARVEVTSSRCGDGCVEVRLADRGPGIAAEDRERVFARFERGQDVAVHDPTVGLGLSVVRELCALHGGEVHAEETPGGGTTIVVRLPELRDPVSRPGTPAGP